MVVRYQATDWASAGLVRLHKLRRATLGWRQPLIEHAPPWACRLLGPLAWRLDMLLVDHGVFRLLYGNEHRLGAHARRSAQPTPYRIRALARAGVRTIVNLRGERQCGSYWLERATCARHGIALVDFRVMSRGRRPSSRCWRRASCSSGSRIPCSCTASQARIAPA